MGQFIPCNKTNDAKGVAHYFFDGMVQLHGISTFIVLNQITSSLMYFGISCGVYGIELKFNMSHHPLTDS